jgi:beta-glucosidase
MPRTTASRPAKPATAKQPAKAAKSRRAPVTPITGTRPRARPGRPPRTARVTIDALRAEAKRLTAQLTVAEKASQMVFTAAAIPRLGIEPYNWWNECLHGVGRAGRATVFPQAIGLAATFDERLVERVFTAVSDEARAKHEAAKRNGYHKIYAGLTFWTPNINIFRDPRWGRGQETYGEDPFLTARLGCAVVRGLQGDHPVWLKTAACAKHFAVHSGPEAGRHGFDAVVDARELRETYLPAFAALVDAGVESVMGAYNRVNGEPSCASPALMRILREEWGFAGHFVSDCGAIDDFHRHHLVTADALGSTVMAIKEGCDLNCGDTYKNMLDAIAAGRLAEADLDRCVERLLLCRLRLGMITPGFKAPWKALPEREIDGPRHRGLARDAARASIVLLKNDGILPLPTDAGAYFVTGPFIDDTSVMLGNYSGNSGEITTVLQGIVAAVSAGTNIQVGSGAGPAGESTAGFGCQWIIPFTNPHAIIAVVGLSPALEGEEGDAAAAEAAGDRISIGLPGQQEAWLKELKKRGLPLVVVLTGGSAISCPWVAEHADAVLQVFYPGCAGGHAVADVLFGKHNPGGRLPFTVPRDLADLPPFTDYHTRGRTYRYAEKAPLWAFGHGLSYTTWRYDQARLSAKTVSAADLAARAPTASVRVANRGKRAGVEVVQAYVRDEQASVPVPRLRLAGFARVALKPGEAKTVAIPLDPAAFQARRDDGSPFVEPGAFQVFIGGGQPGFDLAYAPGAGATLALAVT